MVASNTTANRRPAELALLLDRGQANQFLVRLGGVKRIPFEKPFGHDHRMIISPPT